MLVSVGRTRFIIVFLYLILIAGRTLPKHPSSAKSLAVRGAAYKIKVLENALQPDNNLEVVLTAGKASN